MVKLETTNNQYYKWFSSVNVSIKGWFYVEETYYEGEKATLFFESVVDEFGFIEKLRRMNGNFSIIFRSENFTYAAVDRIMSFPLLYTQVHKDVIISDNTTLILQHDKTNKTVFERNQEMLASGFVAGNSTIFDKIKLIQAGNLIVINNVNSNIVMKKYFDHLHKDPYEKSMDELCVLHEEVLNNVFKRMIKSLNGKQIVLFLSGGYDSRLVAVMLKKLNYTNVTCISFGSKKLKDVRVAKSVADSLGYDWILVENAREYINSVSDTERFKNYIELTSNGFTLPYIQGIIAEKLIIDGLIGKNAVFISGNSGDVIEGDQFSRRFSSNKTYTIEDIIDAIIDKHYTLMGESFSTNTLFREIIKNDLNIVEKQSYNYEECQDIFENFNWKERQSKYVVNDVRSFDTYLNNEWRLPLWDNDLVDFWLKVPTRMREFRKLYYYCVRDEKYKTANVETMFSVTRDVLKKRYMAIVKILYPLRKVIEYFQNKTNFYGVSFKSYIKVILYTKGYRTNTITTRVLWLLKNYYDEMDGNTTKFLSKFF